jgi:ABC-type tungstate transport system substrate-binding protein
MVMGGFIAVLGTSAVALAFTLLNAATFGIAGIVVASIGVAAALTGVGLFATGAYKNSSTFPINQWTPQN